MSPTARTGSRATPRPEAPFDELTDRYDAWYEAPAGRAVFKTEVACLRPLIDALPRRGLEVGVGTGRFAQSLGIEYGVDPSSRMLELARTRGIRTVQGSASTCHFARPPSVRCWWRSRSASSAIPLWY